jgi:hypothetical protein
MLAGRCRLACGQIIRGRGALLINHPNKSLAVASESSNKPLKSQSEELHLGVGTDIPIAARFRQNSHLAEYIAGPSVASSTCFGTSDQLLSGRRSTLRIKLACFQIRRLSYNQRSNDQCPKGGGAREEEKRL